MALTLLEWLKSEEYNQVKDSFFNEPEKFFSEVFVRNPIRHCDLDNRKIKAFSDGILIYQGLYDSRSSILEIKGRKYGVRDILGDYSIDKRFYVFGSFLTTFSVHVVRSSFSGIVTEIKELPPLQSNNVSMSLFEHYLFKQSFNPNFLSYNFYNQRVIVKVYVPYLRTNVYYVLIADTEVNRILVFQKVGDVVMQNERLAYVLYGSQVDLLIEKKPWFRLKKEVPLFSYTRAGIDSLGTLIEVQK